MTTEAFTENFEQPVTMVVDPLPAVNRLKQLESVIEAVERSWEPLARALVEIRDSKLYRDPYETFEQYVEQRWELSRARAYQLMEAIKVKDDLPTTGRHLPKSERQIRALIGLESYLQLKVWLEATKDDPNPSGQRVMEARVKLIGKELKKGPITVNGSVIHPAIERRPIEPKARSQSIALDVESEPVVRDVETEVAALDQSKDEQNLASEYSEALRKVQDEFYERRVQEAEKLYGPTFNARGVCRHLTEDDLVKQFVECLAGLKADTINFDQQAAFAEDMVFHTNEINWKLSPHSVRSSFMRLREDKTYAQRQDDRKYLAEIETPAETAQRTWQQQERLLLEDLHGLAIHGSGLWALMKGNPNVTFRMDDDLARQIHSAHEALQRMDEEFRPAKGETYFEGARGKKVPYNLENLTDAMTGGNIRGAQQTMVEGLGNLEKQQPGTPKRSVAFRKCITVRNGASSIQRKRKLITRKLRRLISLRLRIFHTTEANGINWTQEPKLYRSITREKRLRTECRALCTARDLERQILSHSGT